MNEPLEVLRLEWLSMEDLRVCPKMRCGSLLIFDYPNLPCAKHGLVMVPYSEAPLRKHIYRYFMSKIFKFQYATHKLRRNDATNNRIH